MNRDYGHATGEDKYDKTLLPKVLQVPPVRMFVHVHDHA